MKNNNELEELRDLFDKAGVQTQKLTAPLLNNAIFMSAELEKLTKELQNGSWVSGSQPSGEAKAYNALMGNFNATIKNLYAILNDRMPETSRQTTNEAFAKIQKKAR